MRAILPLHWLVDWGPLAGSRARGVISMRKVIISLGTGRRRASGRQHRSSPHGRSRPSLSLIRRSALRRCSVVLRWPLGGILSLWRIWLFSPVVRVLMVMWNPTLAIRLHGMSHRVVHRTSHGLRGRWSVVAIIRWTTVWPFPRVRSSWVSHWTRLALMLAHVPSIVVVIHWATGTEIRSPLS